MSASEILAVERVSNPFYCPECWNERKRNFSCRTGLKPVLLSGMLKWAQAKF